MEGDIETETDIVVKMQPIRRIKVKGPIPVKSIKVGKPSGTTKKEE